jgi:hypothetical protein
MKILQTQNNINVHVYNSMSIIFRICGDCFRSLEDEASQP